MMFGSKYHKVLLETTPCSFFPDNPRRKGNQDFFSHWRRLWMQEDFLWFSLGRNCGWDIWSSNLEKSYIFQGACHKSGRVWAHRKDGWAEKLFFFPLVWFLKIFLILGSDTHCFTLLFEILPLKPWEERSVLPRCKAGIVWDTLLGFWREVMTDTLWQM